MIVFYSSHLHTPPSWKSVLEKIKERDSIFCSQNNFLKNLFLFLWLKWRKKQTAILFFGNGKKFFLSKIAYQMGMKVFWFLSEESPYRNKRLYRWAIKGTTLITSSQALLEKEKKHYSFENIEAHILRLPFTPPPLRQENFFEEMAYKKYALGYRKNFIIGAIAPLTKESGIEYTFQVIQLLKEQLPHIQLIIVGQGPEKNNLLWLARNIHIAENIRIIGNTMDTPVWMEGFTIFLSPQKNALWYTPELFLAMHCGKPIIAQKSPYTEELLTNTKEAILLDIENKEMVAQAIINMANNPEWLHELGLNAKKRAEELFSPEKWNEEFNKIFNFR